MAEQIAGYIEKERERGFDDNKIKQALLKVGYSEEDIDNAFRTLGSGAEHKTVPEKRAETKETPQQEVMGIPSEKPAWVSKKTIIIIISIIAVIAVIVLGLLYMDSIGIFSISNDIKETDTPIQTDDDVQYILDEHHNKIPVKGAGCDYPTRIKSHMCRAIINNDKSICNDLNENDAISCNTLTTIFWAIKNNDIKPCSGVDDNLKKFCISIVEGDMSYCDTLGDLEINSCKKGFVFGDSIRNSNTEICEKPENNAFDEFEDDFFMDICNGFIENDSTVCEKYYDMRCP